MVKMKTFSCRNCGAALEERARGWSLSIVCASCGSVIDLTDEEKKIISKIDETHEANILLPLGQRGTLKGKEWEILGYMERVDPKYDVFWSEYLLFNPRYGFRWLTEYNGHWSFVITVKERPYTSVALHAKLNSRNYSLFNSGQARVNYVLGEFYWKVQVGEETTLKEYINPPYSLSGETYNDERVWSVGEYIEPEELERGFQLENLLPAKYGVAPNQPSPYKKEYKKVSQLGWIFVGILFLLQFMHLFGTKNEKIFEQDIPIAASQEFVSPVFKLKGNSNLEIQFSSPVNNSWVYASAQLVNDQNGKSYDFEKTIEYYHGYDGGESWSEGDTETKEMISSVPAGDYYLSLQPQKNEESSFGLSSNLSAVTPHVMHVAIRRGTPIWSNFFWALLFTLFPLLINYWKQYSFEVERWATSDYSPYSSE